MCKDFILQEQQKESSIKERVEANVTDVLTWKDPNKNKPKAGQKIIFQDSCGTWEGKYLNIEYGVVYVNNFKGNRFVTFWVNVMRWIEYPKEF